MKAQINEFGQTPKQIFKEPHVQRRTNLIINQQVSPIKKSKLEKIEKKEDKIKYKKKENLVKNKSESLEEIIDSNLKKIENTKSSSLNKISGEIYDLIGEATSNLETKTSKNIQKIQDLDEESNKSDYMDILEQVEKMLPEESNKREPQRNDDAYFNFVSSKCYDLKKESTFTNNK